MRTIACTVERGSYNTNRQIRHTQVPWTQDCGLDIKFIDYRIFLTTPDTREAIAALRNGKGLLACETNDRGNGNAIDCSCANSVVEYKNTVSGV